MQRRIDLGELLRKIVRLEIDELVLNHADGHEGLDTVFDLVERAAIDYVRVFDRVRRLSERQSLFKVDLVSHLTCHNCGRLSSRLIIIL